MPTINITLPATWTKIANAGEDFLASYPGWLRFEVAVTAGDTPPTLNLGHHLLPGEALIRSVIGPGYVWARCVESQGHTLVVTK